jgi:hypothetical protein
MECKCCNREQELRMGFCFDCANAESIIVDGTDMWDKPIEKKEGMSLSLSKIQEILKIYGVVKNKD